MDNDKVFKGLKLALVLLAVWLGIRYLFGIFLPFLFGWLVAALAEPGVQFLTRRFRFSRGLATAVAVTLTLVLMVAVLWLLLALGYRELASLAGSLPEIVQTLGEVTASIQTWILGWVRRAPDGVAAALEQTVTGLFAGGSSLVGNLASGLLEAAGKLVNSLSGGFLALGIGVLSAYMISAQLPGVKKRMADWSWRKKLEPMGKKLKFALGGWLKAQAKLMTITFGIVTAGFLLLRVEGALLWGLLTAVVDAIPLLGTGTVLIPWALVSLFQGETVRAVGMVGLYLSAMLTRSALEPRFVGRQLGVNPLVMLVALYAGFCLWGVGGMILSPLLAVLVTQIMGTRDLRPGEDVV